jgi:hypothetical protein
MLRQDRSQPAIGLAQLHEYDPLEDDHREEDGPEPTGPYSAPLPTTTGVRLLAAGVFFYFLFMAIILGVMPVWAGIGLLPRVLISALVAAFGALFLLIAWSIVKRWPRPESDVAARPEHVGLRTAEHQEVIRLSDLLANLTDREADRVVALGVVEAFAEGAPLAQAGEQADRIYIVAEGRVQLTGSSEVGAVTVRIAGPGESFPLAALVGNGTLVSSARAMTDAAVLVIPTERLLELCDADEHIGLRVYQTVAEVLTDRYRMTLARHMAGLGEFVQRERHPAHV